MKPNVTVDLLLSFSSIYSSLIAIPNICDDSRLLLIQTAVASSIHTIDASELNSFFA